MNTVENLVIRPEIKADLRIVVSDMDTSYSNMVVESLKNNDSIYAVSDIYIESPVTELIKMYDANLVIFDISKVSSQMAKIIISNKTRVKKSLYIITADKIANSTKNSFEKVPYVKILQKPYTYNDIVNIINEYAKKKDELQAEAKMANDELIYITEIMHRMGIPAHIKGFNYIREAIVMCASDDSVIESVTKVMYPAIAKKFNTTGTRVERAIRHALTSAWNNRDNADEIRTIFGYSHIDTKVTNSEFIAFMADNVRMRRLAS